MQITDETALSALDEFQGHAPALAAMPQEPVASELRDLLRQGFMICSSGGSENPFVKVSFKDLRLAQRLHSELCHVASSLASPAQGATAPSPSEEDDLVAAALEDAAKVAETTFTHDTVTKNGRGEPYLYGKAAIFAGERIAAAIRAIRNSRARKGAA